jgi:hypothetical protein
MWDAAVRAQTTAPFTHFLADATGRVIMELYANPAAPIPDYAAQDPLVYHCAFAVEEVEAVKMRLLAAGATEVSDAFLSDGTRLVMLRDPWGIPLQLCKRATPFG